jgi:oligoendopeptidase F
MTSGDQEKLTEFRLLEISIHLWKEMLDVYPHHRVDFINLSKRLTPEHLELIMDDPDEEVRRSIAHKNCLTENQVVRLLQDPDVGVRQAAATHKRAPVDMLRSMVASASSSYLREYYQFQADLRAKRNQIG